MHILRAACLAALFLTIGAQLRADDVTLTSRDGAVEISGTLIGFDGEFYRVETEFGVLTVEGSGVKCDGPACPVLGSYVADIVLTGARSIGTTLIPPLIEDFAGRAGYQIRREDTDASSIRYHLFDGTGETEAGRFTIHLGSSADGFAALAGSTADMALSLREPVAEERDAVRDAGWGDLDSTHQLRVLARDALVPVVAPGNPVKRLTLPQLAEIYAGKITRWSELGGEDAAITPHLTDPTRGIGALFQAQVGSAEASDLTVHETLSDLTAALAADPFGIAISTYSQADGRNILHLAGSCGFDLLPGPVSVKAGDYPLAAPMFLYLPGRHLPRLARDFLTYLRSDAAGQVVRTAGLVDQGLSGLPVAAQGDRLVNAIRAAGDEVGLDELQRMVAVFSDARRLSLTFRFRGGAATLDAPSRANVALLAAALESGAFDGQQLVFAGFSDGRGAAATNLRLSARRAKAVATAVLREAETFDPARVAISTDGFGEASPMACDDTEQGRELNRRVEIWVKQPNLAATDEPSEPASDQ
ncbi:MAG: phosphate ABC transporter substrate-binding/OmpA family protein [Maritimibacter sp.]